MHSHIVQFESHPVTPDDRISETTFYDRLGDIPADYVSDLTSGQEADFINNELPHLLPASMFQCNGRELTFLGVDAEWVRSWQQKVSDELFKVKPDEVAKKDFSGFYPYRVGRAVKNALDIGTRFYSCDDGYIKESTEFLFDLFRLPAGTKIHIGAVLDFHY